MSRSAATSTPSAAWQAQSLLLSYPDEAFYQNLELLRQVPPTLERRVGEPLSRFLDHASTTEPAELAADYVATFDHRRRCCLYLTYYRHGDTRGRGVALLRLKQAYQAAGLRVTDDELPDHLAVMLEFAAMNPPEGRALLLEHRAGLELLRQALREAGSPWTDVLESVSAMLPPLRGDEHAAVAQLAAQGPPEEQVGLTPYGLAPFTPPEVMLAPPSRTREVSRSREVSR